MRPIRPPGRGGAGSYATYRHIGARTPRALASAPLATLTLALAAAAAALAAPAADLPGATWPLGTSDGGCRIFPASNAWHENVSRLPVDPRSSAYIASIGAAGHLHPDFGSNLTYGIPYAVVRARQPRVAIHFTAYGDQFDPGPYPVPRGAPVEGGAASTGDRHVLVLQAAPACRLYELYDASPNADGSWNAGSGALWNLRSNRLRRSGYTSADAAGLPILAGLVRYDEIRAGRIDHALRFTVPETQAGFIHPATHFASSSADPDLPPMGLRLRLKASYPIAGFPRVDRIILRAMKTYGLIVADNGSSWYFQGATDPRWNNAQLDRLKTVPGSAFEAVQSGPIQH